MNKIRLIIIIFILILSVVSCYDANEVTSVSFVQLIGIDKGISDKWRITVKLASMQNGNDSTDKSGEASQQTKTKTVSIEAPSFHAGINLLNTNIPQKLNFSHATLLVISEQLAQSGLIGEYIAPLIRFKEIRRNLNVVVARDSAEEFVEKTVEFTGGSPTRAVKALINEAKNTGFFPKVTLYDFYNSVKSTYKQPVLPLGSFYQEKSNKKKVPGEIKFNNTGQYFAGDTPRKGGNTVEFLGCALFNDDKMIARLDGHQTRMMMILKGEFEKGIFTIQDPNVPQYVIPIDLKLSRKPQVKISIYKGKPIINVKIQTEGDILAIQSNIDYQNEEMIKAIEQTMIKYLNDGIKNVINKCKTLNIDVFNFGCKATRCFFTIQDLEEYNWNKNFKDASIDINIDFNVRRTGGLLKTSNINERKQK